jgi:lambda family phage tail tape measure protein
MVKLVDEAVRLIGSFAKRAALAFKGDFAGAQAEADRFGADFMKRFQANMGQFQRLFTDAPSPGTGRRTGRTALDMSGADARAAAEAKRAANEAERLQQRRNTLTQQLVDLQESLRRKVEDANAAFANVGGTPVEKLLADRTEAIRENDRTVDDLTQQVVKLFRDIRAAGGEMNVKPLETLINQLSKANTELANQQLTQGLKDLLPSLDDYDAKIREVQNDKKVLTEVEKLNAQINLLQLDILAATNPALAEHIRLLRDRAAALDDANKKQKEQEDSFGANFNEKIKAYYESISNFGAQVGDAVVNTFQGLEDQLTSFVTTGKANFTDLANSIIADIARIAIRQAIIRPLVGGVMDLFNIPRSAMGNVFAQNGIQKFARGGIVDKPTMFPFAKGIGLMGEAGPEAIMPLRRGRDGRLGVQAANGGGAVSVTVNVDAAGSNVQGDGNQANQLGKAIGIAVQQELIKQKRPGGLLA